MNATTANEITVKARANDKASQSSRIFGRIQDRASKGHSFLLCRSNKQSRADLKSAGFRSILIGPITLLWW